jgi:hypothetical protein
MEIPSSQITCIPDTVSEFGVVAINRELFLSFYYSVNQIPHRVYCIWSHYELRNIHMAVTILVTYTWYINGKLVPTQFHY